MNPHIGGKAPSQAAWHAVALAAFLVLLFGTSLPAEAQFHVAQPDVVKGEAVVGDHAAIYSDHGTEEKLRQGHEVEAIYDFTDRWELVAKGLFLEPIGEPLEAKNYQLGLHYELVQRHGEGLALAFRTFYGFSAESGVPDDLIYGPLARLVLGKNSATINSFFVSQVGPDADPGSVALRVNWQMRRELGRSVGLGVEGYSDIKDLAHAGSFEDQLHRLGPMLYLDLRGRHAKETNFDAEAEPRQSGSLRVATGVLFGLSEATSDVTFKLDLSAAFY
jgi:hypothetical protein